jgi:hypothetical protein
LLEPFGKDSKRCSAVTDHITAVSQARLTALLRYRQHGDFAAFCRAADLAIGTDVSSEPYYCANLLLGYQIAGLCEVSNVAGSTRWWVAHVGDIRISSRAPKEIGALPDWFEQNKGRAVPLIADSNGDALVLGSWSTPREDGGESSIFDRSLTDSLPSFKHAERQLCEEVSFSADLGGDIDSFEPTTGRWISRQVETLRGSELIRVRNEYAGVTHYVQHSSLGLRFRLPQPEWAFVAAFFLLPWPLVNLIELGNQQVAVRRVVRLPILMYRLLFAAAARTQIGPIVTFSDVSSECISGFRAYFGDAGDRT